MLTPTPSIDRMPGLLALYADRLAPQDKTPLTFLKARFGIVDDVLAKADRVVIQTRSDGVVQGYNHKSNATDFIKAPDGSLDFGEITPAMSKAMRRQAGKIRLQHGVQNADGTGHGLIHIEARHGKQIRDLGYKDIASFVADAVKDFDEIWMPKITTQIVAIVSDKRGRAIYLELSAAQDDAGDFYRVNSAFPVGHGYAHAKELKEGWKPLWRRYPVSANASGASGFAGQSPKAGETTPMVSPQSGITSLGATNDIGKRLLEKSFPRIIFFQKAAA